MRSFPQDFRFGAATSAYQIEGSPLADGAGPSNWHAYSHQPGRIDHGDTADVACDHYRRWREDIGLMRTLGLQAYRYSIGWSRVFPEGGGRLNRAGLDFYKRLTAALCEAGIEPFITLHHWDLPLALDRRGGWLDPDTPRRYADYAHTLFRELDGYAPHWVTLNEPWVMVDAGYVHGVHPPGRKDPAAAARAAHHLLLGHALAVDAYRADGLHHIGIAINLEPKYAAGFDPAELAAARRAHVYQNQWFLDPLLLGSYPAEMPDIFGAAWPAFPAADLCRIHRPIDFLGINYYSRQVVADAPGAAVPGVARVRQDASPHTAMDWEVYPEGLTQTLLWVHRRYGGMPLYITENGAAYADPPPTEGRIEDPQRVDYLHAHLSAALDAIAAGVDLRGYFVWSLLDNFEWTRGYGRRFGLYAIDRATGARIPKRSAEFYGEIIRSGRLPDPHFAP